MTRLSRPFSIQERGEHLKTGDVMASGATVLEDLSILSKVDQALYRLERFFAVLSGVAAFSLVLLAVVSVSGRNFLNTPLPGYVDWIEQAMPLIAFLAISYTQRDGSHIRMDIVVGRLSGRVLWGVELLTTLGMFLLMMLLIWGTWSHFDRSFDFDRPMWSNDSTIDISLPLWPAKLLAPIAFSILAIRMSIQIIGYGKAFLKNISEPVAVPLVMSAEAQAAEEAEHVSGADN